MDTEVEILKFKKTKHGVVELREDNILVFRPDLATFKSYNLQILEELLETFIEVTNGIPRLYLCDNRYLAAIINREEQAYINEHFSKFATHAAMITNSSLVTVMVNSYNAFFKPKVEIKLFTTEKAATDWLLTRKDL